MPTRQEEDEMIKQRERVARGTSTRVPNLAALVNDSPKHPPVSRYGEPAKPIPTKMTQQEQDLLAKQREREARGMSRSQLVPNLGTKLSPVGRNSKPSVVQKAGFPSPPGVHQWQQPPSKMSQEERDSLLKQQEKAARRTSSKVNNLAEKLNPTKPSARTTVQPTGGGMPGGSPIPQEQQDALLKQRLKQQELSSRRTSSKVHNLAEKLNPTNPSALGAAESTGGTIPGGRPMPQVDSRRMSSRVHNLAAKLSPTQSARATAKPTVGTIPGGPPMSRDEEDALLKQRLKEADLLSRRTSSRVQNLAEKLSPTNTARATAHPNGNIPGGPPFSQQSNPKTKSRDEENAQIKRREMSARLAMPSSVVPGISRRVTDSAVASNQSKSRSVSRDVEDAFAKQSELNGRRAVSGPLPGYSSRTTTTTPPPTRPQERTESSSSSLQARYHAAGLALGIEDGADLMMQGDIYGSHHIENEFEAKTQEDEPAQLDSEEVIRERYRAAAVAMGGGTQEDEDMQIKAREREAARTRPPAASTTIGQAERVGSSTGANQSSDSAHADDMSFLSEDAQAKLQGRQPTQSAVINDMRNSMSNEDARAKSRGRMERPSSAVHTVHDDVVAGEADPAATAQQVIVPGAFACNMGEREHLSKPQLPAHPEIEPTPDDVVDEVGRVQELESMISGNGVAPPFTDERAIGGSTELPEEVDEEATRDAIPDGETRETGVETFREDPKAEEKTTKKKKWIWIVVAVLIVAIGGGVGGALAAGGSSSGTDAPGIATTDAPTEAPTVGDPPDVIAARSILSGVSSPSSFADRSSPQSLALSWIASEDTMSEIPEDGIESQPKFLIRYVLAVFYYSLGGESWLGSSGWLDADTDECGWEHVTCNVDGVIESINGKDGNNFAGTIPSELQHLAGLESLHLDKNRISAIAGPLGTTLRSLHLENNQLEGSFPEGIFAMTSLTSLALKNNRLSGTLTTDIGNLQELTHLSLRENSFTGFLTDEFKSLTKLKKLLLSSNSFQGEVNFLLDGLPALEHIELRENAFTGTIQPGLEKLTGLQRFEVGGNLLAGPLPMFLANATGLLGLDLSDNDFVGTIGSEIGQLTNLQRLRLHQCSLTGSIPSEIGQLNRLLDLTLEINLLENAVPSEIGNLRNLALLSMQQNFLSGTIPTEIGGLVLLRTLLLDNNDFTGTVPVEFATLANLEELRLGANFQMSGSIPSEVCALPNLRLITVMPSDITCDCGPICM